MHPRPAPRRLVAALCLLALNFATGCDSGPGAASNGGGPTTASTQTANRPTVAVIPKGTTHLHWKSVEAGAKKAGEEFGVNVLWKGPLTENDAAQQIGLVEQFTQEGVAGLAVAPLDANQLRRPVQQAAAKKIPVVVFDSALTGQVGKDYISYVATDNRKGGVLAGEELARLLNGKGKVVLVRYAVGSASTDEREAGFLSVMEKHPDLNLISKDRYSGATVGEAQKNAENMIDILRQADAIFCPNESSTQGMLNVLQANGLAGKKIFVGFDASPALVTAMKAGHINALVAQNPLQMGYDTVRVLALHLRGEKPPEAVDTGCALVTKENLDTPGVKKVLGQ